MQLCLKNLVDKAGISLDESLRMVSLYPAKAIGRSDQMGRIEIGLPAHLVCMNQALNIEALVSSDLSDSNN